jgi:prefoldin subunit 4
MFLLLMISLQLSKEDEAAAGGDEIEVRREDQDKINKFSRLHQKEISLEDELKTKHVSAASLDLRCSSELC